MYDTHNQWYHYQCPGRLYPCDDNSTHQIHFPEHPKIYPLDISMEASLRDAHNFPSLSENHISNHSWYC